MKNLGIVKSFMAFFNLEEEGKVLSFYGKVEKAIEKEIKVTEFNYEHDKFRIEGEISDLKDQLEDAKDEFEQSFIDVDMNDIQTKQQQENAVDSYLYNIKDKESKVKRIEALLADKKTELKELTSNKKENLDKLNSRLSKLSEGIDVSDIVQQ